MAFDEHIFTDGESSYDVPYWRQVVEQIDSNLDTFSYKEEMARRRRIQEDEIGIKHPKNNSFIKIKDDGTIEAFAGSGSGIRINPDETMQFFGNIQMIGNKFQGVTGTNNASFNEEALSGSYPPVEDKGKSPRLRELMEELKGSDD